MEHCTGFVVTGPVIRFAKDAAADVKLVGNFLIRPDKGRISDNGMPGLFYFAGDKPIRFEGQGNSYHWLNHFVEKPGDPGEFITKQEDFQKILPKLKGVDIDSTWVPRSPTLRRPIRCKTLGRWPIRARWRSSFMPRIMRRSSACGVTRWDRDDRMPLAEPIVAKTPMPVPKTKIVDADKAGLELGVYSSLAAAITDAKDGDTILIRHGNAREVVVKPCTLPNGITITVKPENDKYNPILILDANRLDRDLAMFTVQVGALHLQNLEFRLDPSKTGYVAQSVVQLGESAHCSFKNCVCTLQHASRRCAAQRRRLHRSRHGHDDEDRARQHA